MDGTAPFCPSIDVIPIVARAWRCVWHMVNCLPEKCLSADAAASAYIGDNPTTSAHVEAATSQLQHVYAKQLVGVTARQSRCNVTCNLR